MRPARNLLGRLFLGERRKAGRQRAPALVAYYWTGANPVAHGVRDISLTGFYLLTEDRWYPDTVLLMTLQKTGGIGHAPSGRSIAVQSKAVRSGADGVGFAFLFLGAAETCGGLGLLNAADRKTFAEFVLALRSEESQTLIGCALLALLPLWPLLGATVRRAGSPSAPLGAGIELDRQAQACQEKER